MKCNNIDSGKLFPGACLVVLVAILVCLSPARAEHPQPLARIGEVWFQDAAGAAPFHRAFLDGMRNLGYQEGRNILVFTRYADGNADRVGSILDELLSEKVDVFFVSQKVVRQAGMITKSVPIVCATMSDPVHEGVVASLTRPGGNITGLSWQSNDTAGKRLEIAGEMIHDLKRVAILFDPDYAGALNEIGFTGAQKLPASVGCLFQFDFDWAVCHCERRRDKRETEDQDRKSLKPHERLQKKVAT